MPALNNESDVLPYLKLLKTWRVLWAYEAGLLTPDEAARAIGVCDASEFQWVRSVAFTQQRTARCDSGHPKPRPHQRPAAD